MDSYSSVPADASTNKRPRSPSISDVPPPSSKSAKTNHHSNHLQINYLARQYNENIPLVSTEDNLPSILRLIADYDGVLHTWSASSRWATLPGPRAVTAARRCRKSANPTISARTTRRTKANSPQRAPRARRKNESLPQRHREHREVGEARSAVTSLPGDVSD